MGLILLEAGLALVVLLAIVWWTMFSGRKRGELPASQAQVQEPSATDRTGARPDAPPPP